MRKARFGFVPWRLRCAITTQVMGLCRSLWPGSEGPSESAWRGQPVAWVLDNADGRTGRAGWARVQEGVRAAHSAMARITADGLG